MRKGDIKIKKIDGQDLKVSFSGKGVFTECWLEGETVWSFSTDVVKECLARWSDQTNPHVPNQDFVDWACENRKGENVYLYKGKLYYPLTAKSKIPWQQFKTLAKANEQARSTIMAKHGYQGFSWSRFGHSVAQETINLVSDKLPSELVEGLQTILDAACNAGSSVTFEFAKRNLAVDESGNLILLDIVFDTEKV